MPPPVAKYVREDAARRSQAATLDPPSQAISPLAEVVPQGWANPFHSAIPGRPADFRRDQIRSELFAPPYTDPMALEPWAGETGVMQQAFLRVHRTEPAIRSALDGKIKAVACLDVAVTPQNKEDPRERENAEFIEWAVGVNSERGWEGLIFDVARPACMLGWSVTEKVLGPSDRMAPPKWKGRWALARGVSKDVTRLRLQLDVFRNVVGIVSLVAGMEMFDPAKVILYSHDPLFSNPYGQSDLRPCYRAAMLIEDAYKLWYVLLKNNNGPVVHGKTSKQDQVNKLRDALTTLRANGVLATAEDTDVQLLDFAAQGSFDAFERFVSKLREEIYLAVRGAFLPFLEGSGQDNPGDTAVQKGAASDPYEHMLAKSLGRVFTHQLAADLTLVNCGTDVGVPIVTLGGVSWGETKQQLDAVKTVMVDLGRPVSAKYIEQISSVPGPADDADTATAPQAAAPAGDPFGGSGGGGGGDPLAALGLGDPSPTPTPAAKPDDKAQFAAPPRQGLVPKSGDPQHPGRWVRPQDADGAGDKGEPNHKPDAPASGDLVAAVELAGQAEMPGGTTDFAEDAKGHDHKGKGPGGGQFAPKGKGGDGGSESKEGEKPGGKPKATRGEMVPARRTGAGKEAKVLLGNGKKAAPGHIKPSMIPPQWTDVKVSTDPQADLLVTGRDAKGRPIAVYSDAFHMRSAAVKFARVKEGLTKASSMAAQNQRNRSDPALKENADCVWLMQEQATRPGSDKDTGGKVKAYGAATLEGRHVVRADDGVRLQFVGKEGVYHDHLIRNPKLAAMLAERADAAGPAGRLFDTDYAKVAAYTKGKLDGGAFTPKDFRTIKATQLALGQVAKMKKPPATEAEYTAAVKKVAVAVSGVLGNRPQQALESYIAPEVFSGWRAGLGTAH